MSKRGSVPIVRVELPFMADLNPTLRIEVFCQGVARIARGRCCLHHDSARAEQRISFDVNQEGLWA